jgi:hypothetical protein
VLPLLKVGIMIEWCRMFVPHGSVTKTAFWWGCVIVSFIQIGAAVATIIALNLQCIPHAAIWDFTIPNAKCFKLYNLQVSSASIQLISDICMLLLPQRVIWTLKMSWQKRMGVSVIFGLGVLYVLSLVSSFVHSRRWPLLTQSLLLTTRSLQCLRFSCVPTGHDRRLRRGPGRHVRPRPAGLLGHG